MEKTTLGLKSGNITGADVQIIGMEGCCHVQPAQIMKDIMNQ